MKQLYRTATADFVLFHKLHNTIANQFTAHKNKL